MVLGPGVPGETPLEDISGLRIRRVTSRTQLNQLEADNIRRALLKYLTKRPTTRSAKFDLPWCLKLHKEMFGRVWKWAGTIRTQDLNIGVHFPMITQELQALLDDLHSWSGYGMDLLEQSARLHYRVVRIHPFPNGNGRWSRMLANIWLRRGGAQIVQWPDDVNDQTSIIRNEYIAAVKSADDGDLDPLIEMHRRYHKRAKG